MRVAHRRIRTQVRPLCQRLAPELLRDPPELALEKLSEQLGQATEAQSSTTS